ncbi:MAG: outer membrane protein assembly factor BamA [Rhodobacteraceae bacterium]|nr:outer membrane protein assembly factor BamA [Paracoccaceae bacterium]
MSAKGFARRCWLGLGGVVYALLSGALILTTTQVEAQTYSYDEVVIEGNLRIGDESILRFADLPPSGQVSADDLGAAYRRMADAVLFEEIEIRPEGRRLIIEVAEYPIINEISIEGNRRIEDEPLLELVQSTPRRIYLPSQAEQDANAIAQQYRFQGRLAAEVTPKIIRRSDNRVDLVFEVVEGRVIETERISFIGNRAYADSVLRDELASRQAGILRTFVKTDTYIEERIAQDHQNLTDFYRNRGYVDFEIVSVSAELTAERIAFRVVFTIEEGPRYRFGEITASSEIGNIDANEMLAEFQGQSGGVFSPDVIRDTLSRMEFLAVSQGERFVFVEPEQRRNVERQTVDLNFRIYRAERNFVERIDITGNTTTLDYVIRREFRIVEGGPYNQREIDEAVDRIRALGFFSSVDVTTVRGSSPNQAVVRVEVEERPTGSLSFGAAWSEDGGITGTVALSERNLLGRGQYLGLSIETGDNASYAVTFIEPRFLDREVALRLSTSLNTTRGFGLRFNTEQWRVDGDLTYPISDTTNLTVGGGFSTYRMESYFGNYTESNLPNPSLYPSLYKKGDPYVTSFQVGEDFKRGKGDRVFVNYGLDYNSLRTGYERDSGFSVQFGQELSQGTSDDSTILKSSASLLGQTSLMGGKLRLTGELEGGVVTGVSGDTRLRDRFRMHSGMMRGFASNGIGPRDFFVGITDYVKDTNRRIAANECIVPSTGNARSVGKERGQCRLTLSDPATTLSPKETDGEYSVRMADQGPNDKYEKETRTSLEDFKGDELEGRPTHLYTDPLGGNYFAAMRLESRFPLGLPEEVGVNGGLFFDMGSVWGLDDKRCASSGRSWPTDPNTSYYFLGKDQDGKTYLDKDNEIKGGELKKAEAACVVDDGFKLRSTVGVSLFWETIFGPLRMNFSHPIQSESYDRKQSFDIGIASTF